MRGGRPSVKIVEYNSDSSAVQPESSPKLTKVLGEVFPTLTPLQRVRAWLGRRYLTLRYEDGEEGMLLIRND